jgi:hypothetical protein
MEGVAKLHGLCWCHQRQVIADFIVGVINDIVRVMIALRNHSHGAEMQVFELQGQ